MCTMKCDLSSLFWNKIFSFFFSFFSLSKPSIIFTSRINILFFHFLPSRRKERRTQYSYPFVRRNSRSNWSENSDEFLFLSFFSFVGVTLFSTPLSFLLPFSLFFSNSLRFPFSNFHGGLRIVDRVRCILKDAHSFG